MIERDAFARLNTAQHEAATHGELLPDGGVRASPLLVIAGAGTGKTSTLAHRVAHLLLNGAAPERLLLLTGVRRRRPLGEKPIEAVAQVLEHPQDFRIVLA